MRTNPLTVIDAARAAALVTALVLYTTACGHARAQEGADPSSLKEAPAVAEMPPLNPDAVAVGRGEGPHREEPAAALDDDRSGYEDYVSPLAPVLQPEASEPETAGNIDLEQVRSLRDERRGAAATPAPVERTDDAATRPASDGVGPSILQAMAALCTVLGLFLVLAYLARRFGRRSPLFAGMHLAQDVGRVYLTQKISLHFVRAGGRVLVVGVSPTQVNLVAEYEESAFAGVLRPTGVPAPTVEEEPDSAEAGSQREGGFVGYLRRRMVPAKPRQPSIVEVDQPFEDGEIAALREELRLLQQYVGETPPSEKGR